MHHRSILTLRSASPTRLALAIWVCTALAAASDLAFAQSDTPETDGTVAVAETRVLVLPIRVNTSRSADAMGAVLNERIRGVLDRNDRMSVVSPEETNRALASLGGGAVSLADAAILRELGREANADAVITGSLTELAGRFSLDLRITPALEGERARSVVLTSDSSEELLEGLTEAAGRVGAGLARAEQRVVRTVVFDGALEIEEELRQRIRVSEGQVYDEAAVRRDQEAIAAHPQVGTVSVETAGSDRGVELRWRIVRSEQLLVLPAAEAGEIVARIEVRGNRRIDTGAIRARIGTEEGEALRPGRIAQDVREIFGLGFFRDVQVRRERGPDGTVVVYDVEESPVVRQISISGNDEIEAEDIKEILTLTTGSTLDLPLLKDNVIRIESLYKAQGYYLAEVGYRLETIAPGSIGINFEVDEKEWLWLRDIEFVGNRAYDDDQLQEDFATKTVRFYSLLTSWLDKTGTYSEPIFLTDLRRVQKKYTDTGYLQAEVGEPEVIANEDGLVVKVEVREGPQFNVGAVDVSGDDSVDVDVLKAKLQLEEGEVFNRTHLTEDVEVLERHYTDRGFYFAGVQPLTRLNEEEQIVDVEFEVQKGPLYFIRNVEVSGNTRTIDPVIRREVQIVEGQLYSARAIADSHTRIRRLGFFEDVRFEPVTTDDPSQLDLDVQVVERPTGSFSFGAGFSSQDRFVLNASIQQTNLFGRGYFVNLNANVSTGGRSNRYGLTLSDPYFLGSTWSLGFDFSLNEIRFQDFENRIQGLSVRLGHPLNEDATAQLGLRYGFSEREIRRSTTINSASPILRERLQGRSSSSLVGLRITSDTRDDRFSPVSGDVAVLGMDFAGLGGFTRYLRFEGRYAHYFGAPDWLFDRSTFVFATRIGYAIPLNSISDYDISRAGISGCLSSTCVGLAGIGQVDDDLELPLSERYFLGGVGTFPLRGYRGASVGPRRAILRRYDLSQPANAQFGTGGDVVPVGAEVRQDLARNRFVATCNDQALALGNVNQGNQNGRCNDISDKDDDEFEDLDETDVIGGASFISTSFEYRFPISDEVGLQGLFFFDMGDAFAEGENLFDVTEWRYGYGAGLLWFSPFGPLQLVLGWPVDPLEIEDSPVFEFSVGGVGL